MDAVVSCCNTDPPISTNFLFRFDDAGRVGRISLALSDMLREDIKSGPDRIPVPYSLTRDDDSSSR